MNFDRRQFLKASALAAATTVATQRALGASAFTPATAPGASPIQWDKAPCRFCGTGCHVSVGVQDGRVVAIQGEPLAEVNKGLLCVKGYHVGAILYGADRLKTPMLRRNGKLEPISWDEAIEVMAQRIHANPDEFAIYGSGQWTIPEGYAAQKLIKGGLSNNHIDPNARLCMASAVTGYISVYGVDEPAGCYTDLDECDVLIMWGNNPAEMHPVLFSRVIDRRSRGQKVMLIDIGTRRTRTSEYCDEYLEFRPQTDLAIANGIAHLLLANDTWNEDFVGRYCNFRKDGETRTLLGEASSFEEYKRLLEPYTPEYVEALSGVPAEKIRLLADLFARRDLKITSIWCMGMNQHTRGTDINRLVHSVHLLSGHFGTPGDAPTSLTGQPSACGTAREVGTLAHALPGGRVVNNEEHRQQCEELWNLPPGRINPKPGYHTVLMWEKFCQPSSEGGDIATIWVQVTNPGQTLPDLHRLFRGKKNLEDKFLIVSEVYPTATTDLADLVLPAAMWVEKNGIFGNSERRTQQWYKMVEPPGEARDDCWMTIALARRLFELGHEGMRDKDGEFIFTVRDEAGRTVPIWEWEHYYDLNIDRALYEEYRGFSRLKHKDLAPYEVLAKARGLRWPVIQKPDGSWHETPYRFSAFSDPYVNNGAPIQFYHSTTHDDRAQIWFCPYEPAAEEPSEAFPFWLCTGRVLEHWHTGTMTRRVPQLRNAMPHAYVEMHPADAAAKGLSNGDIAVIETPRGKIELPVWTNGRGRPPQGSLFIPFFDENVLVNEITLGAVDPISKEPDYKKCSATVYRKPPPEPRPGRKPLTGAPMDRSPSQPLKPATLRATTLTLTIIAVASASGFFMGLRQSLREAEQIGEAPARHSGEHPAFDQASHLPVAPTYTTIAHSGKSPNAQWSNRLSNLGAPSKEEARAWAMITSGERREQRHTRRAYDGAPPVVPHPIDQHTAASCLQCHGQATQIGALVAPQMSHEPYTSCTQCHVSSEGLGSRWNTSAYDLHSGNRFGGYTAPTQGDRAHEFAPPTIPHTTRMRDHCLSCHGPLGSSPIRTTHPDRQSCTQCHAPNAEMDQRRFLHTEFPIAASE